MDIEQLRQLDAIERTGTISGAAAQLSISQPALSRSIQRLEMELGQPLIDRSGRHSQLNEAGRIALDYARQILRDERLMREALSAYSRRESVLSVATVAPAPLWRLTAQLIERFPQTMLTSQTLSREEVERAIINGQIDLGISTHPVMLPTVRYTQLMTESLSVVLPAEHPLASRSTLSAAELDGETFLLYNQIGFWKSFCDTALTRSRFVTQEDRTVFAQLAKTTDLLYFVSDAPQNAIGELKGKVVVPLRDATAHATFYLLVSDSARPEACAAFDWVASV